MILSDVENFSFDYDTVYVGVMSPEENMIVILQNVLMFIYSSIGYVMLLPFYQVRNVRRSKSGDGNSDSSGGW